MSAGSFLVFIFSEANLPKSRAPSLPSAKNESSTFRYLLWPSSAEVVLNLLCEFLMMATVLVCEGCTF